MLNGDVGTGGSTFDGSNPVIAKAGLATNMDNGRFIWGPLPFPDQGILQAEVWAVRCALLLDGATKPFD